MEREALVNGVRGPEFAYRMARGDEQPGNRKQEEGSQPTDTRGGETTHLALVGK